MTKLQTKILFIVFVFIIFFVLFEIGIRILWKEPVYGYPEGLHIPDDILGFKYSPNFVGNFNGAYDNIEIRTNAQGLRDYEHNYTKPVGKIRILGLGDSATFGPGVEFEDTYLQQLEKKLLNNGFNVEIIKAGVNHYEFDQEYTYYFNEGYNYDPDIIFVGVALNDPTKTDPIKLKNEMISNKLKEPENTFKNFISKNFKSAKFTYWLFKNTFILKGKDYNDDYFKTIYSLWDGESWEYYKSKLLDLNYKLKKDNKKLVLIVFPYTQQFNNSMSYGRMPQEKLLNLSVGTNMTVIDLTTDLDLPNYSKYYLPLDNVHLNAAGQKKVSEILYEWLINNSLKKK